MSGVFFCMMVLASCQPAGNAPQAGSAASGARAQDRSVAAIPLPAGYIRVPCAQQSYGAYLRRLPLKKDRTVYLFNGQPKRNQSAQYAVLDIDVGNKDLQQCADAVIRLRAEYLYARKRYANLAFTFSNGFSCDYEHYARGYRLQFKGNNCNWVKQQAENRSYAAFRQYLDLVYSYAGTASLNKQLQAIPLAELQAGDVFLQSRQPYGHAVTVMDLAYNPKTNDTIFLLAQSYMPAQSIHILNNPADSKLSPWYTAKFSGNLQTPEWTFAATDLKRF